MTLKVLHVHDSDLDDPRIINAATTGKKQGFSEYFCGMKLDGTLPEEVFYKHYWVGFSTTSRVAKRITNTRLDSLWQWYPYPRHHMWLENQFNKVINEVRPDIIHAHNIFAGHYCMKHGIPMVLDDHELYSLHMVAKHENDDLTFRNKMRVKVKHDRWQEWEIEIGEKYPIISVSDKISNHHKKYCSKTYTIPNFPMKSDFEDVSNSTIINNTAFKGKVTSIYIGSDSVSNFHPIRDINGLYDLFNISNGIGNLARIGVVAPITENIRSYGYLPMQDAYNILKNKCQIGLLPWKKHWFHEYCSPNKVYEYAHCGLWLITTENMNQVLKDFGEGTLSRPMCDRVEDLEELEKVLKGYNENPESLNKLRFESLKYAKENLIWEKEEHKILEAYKVA